MNPDGEYLERGLMFAIFTWCDSILGYGRVYCGPRLYSFNFSNIDANIGPVHWHNSCNKTAEWTNEFYNSEKR